MKPSPSAPPEQQTAPAKDQRLDPDSRRGWTRFGWAVLAWTLAWIGPLIALTRLSLRDDLYSHVLLVPAVAVYLVWIDRPRLPNVGHPLKGVAALLGVGAAVCAVPTFLPAAGLTGDIQLSLRILAYVLGVGCAGALFLGRETLRFCQFSFLFLLFLVPPPKFVIHWLEVGLQHTSADVAEWFINASQTPLIREGLFLRLPGVTLEVAPECSGIRSTLVLFVVSVIAGKMFLLTPWRRTVLALSIIPLGIARNAFRIFTLGYLSVHWDPAVLHSALHKQGGPLFFVLSLIPLNLLLWVLYRSERSLRPPQTRV
ncbi:MAG TPA: exosortase/archaeosortase family protein [Verrucomicrobiota bacterium]|nr:exosortase/archaeosortase family protein [Verrucomicrobiota bacterium]